MIFSIAVGIPGTFQGTADHQIFGRQKRLGVLTVGLPAAPSFRKMLKDSLCLILLDRLRHHIKNVVHNSSTELKIIMGLDSLLGDSLRDTFAVAALELTSEQVSEPGAT